MSTPKIPAVSPSLEEGFGKSVISYIVGFALSLGLTAAAYIITTSHSLSHWTLIGMLVALALVQTVVQLIFFLHLRQEAEPRWKLLVFDFMLVIVVILVFGTLWIMNNLDYNMSPPEQTDHSVMNNEGIHL